MRADVRARVEILRRDDGAAALEFSIVSIFLFVFMYAIIMYGFIFGVHNSVTHAAGEAARAAISKPTAAQRIDHAKKTALQRLPEYVRIKMDVDGDGDVDPVPPDAPADIQATEGPCIGAPTSACLHVKIVFPWNARPIVGHMPGFGLLAPDVITADAEVQVD